MDQTPRHGLMHRVLSEACGEDIESLMPPMRGESRADILFRSHCIVAEIKELTSERSKDPKVAETLNHRVTVEGPAQGGPITFGDIGVRIDQPPDRLARQSMRILTKRAQREFGQANKQMKHSKRALGMEEAKGLLVFIAPPMNTNLRVIG